MSYARGGFGRGGARVGVLAALLVGVSGMGAGVAGQEPPGDLKCLTPSRCLETAVPKTEPHGAICSTCHDLYKTGRVQATSATCASTGCH